MDSIYIERMRGVPMQVIYEFVGWRCEVGNEVSDGDGSGSATGKWFCDGDGSGKIWVWSSLRFVGLKDTGIHWDAVGFTWFS
jgi:hypothetical protein